MKKYIPYILILIALVGLFSLATEVRAEDLGTCKYYSSGTTTAFERTTQTVCRAKAEYISWHISTLIEFQTEAAAGNTPPVAGGAGSGTTKGTCTQVLAANEMGPPQTISDITQADCQAKGTNWKWTSSSIYNLLAPLPCTGDATTGCNGGQLTTYDPTGAGGGALGAYLNIMIKLFIGICAVLAVIMIVMGGIQYMTSELISSKEAGKERIRNAIFGLLLALGAWTLLNTINPDLLKTDLTSLADVTVTVDLMPETENFSSAVQSDGGAPAGPTTGCPEGIGRTTGGISVCNRLVSQVNNMIAAARTATPSCSLTGGGYRSPDRQIQLRTQNCNGNTTDRNAPCTPPTALPGASRHQQGLAIDFGDSGTTIGDSSNKCFVWLQANAGTYGLSNLPSEPWHWSVDGR